MVCALVQLIITTPRYPNLQQEIPHTGKVYTGYHGTSEIEHGLCSCTVDNPLTKACGLSLRTGAQTMLSEWIIDRTGDKSCCISHLYAFIFFSYKSENNKTFQPNPIPLTHIILFNP